MLFCSIREQLVESAKTTGRRLKEFDREHAVVHRATQGAKQAWRDLRHVRARVCATHAAPCIGSWVIEAFWRNTGVPLVL